MANESLPLFTRLWFAFVCSLRVLMDGRFAKRVWLVRDGMPALPEPTRDRDAHDRAQPDSEPPDSEPPDTEAPDSEAPDSEAPDSEIPAVEAAPDVSPALVLLSLLQREGRLVDFLEQEITDFDDADIGAAVRVVHEGCRKVLRGHATIEPVRTEEEESRVEVRDGIKEGRIKLTGDVSGKAPYRGVLRHRGWRVSELSLPTPLSGHDANVVAPAEVEI